MAEFNPITDLMPMDSSEESVDESSEQIKVIRTQLIETRNSVANVLNIIKTKNSLLDRDLDKIRSLNDRLQRTIPRIPIMRGKAGVQFGDTIEEEKNKGGLNIPRFPPRSRSKEKVVTYARPGVKKALDTVGNIINVGSDIYFLKNLFSGSFLKRLTPGANKIAPAPGVGSPIKVNPNKTPIKMPSFLEKVTNPVKKKFAPTEKTGPLLNFKKENVSSIYDLSPAARMRMANVKNFPGISKKGQQVRLTKEFKKTLKKSIGQNEEFLYFDYLKTSKLTSPTKLKIDLNKAFLNERQNLVNLKNSGNINEKMFAQRSKEIQKTYLENVTRIDRYELETKQQFENILNFFKSKPKGRKSRRRSSVPPIKDLIKKQKEVEIESESFKSTIVKPSDFFQQVKMVKDGKGGFRFEKVKDPNDLGSLNIDTGTTNTFIIFTDPPN